MIKVRGTDELMAAAVLFRNADRETRRALAKESRAWAPTIVRAAKRRAVLPQDHAVAESGKVSITSKGIVATFGSAGRLSSTGTHVGEVTRAYEFGTESRERRSRYVSRQRSSGKEMYVQRRTRIELPRRTRSGRFIYPAVADTAPDLVGRYVRAVARAVTS